jgi:hypothetical protein
MIITNSKVVTSSLISRPGLNSTERYQTGNLWNVKRISAYTGILGSISLTKSWYYRLPVPHCHLHHLLHIYILSFNSHYTTLNTLFFLIPFFTYLFFLLKTSPLSESRSDATAVPRCPARPLIPRYSHLNHTRISLDSINFSLYISVP